MRAAWGCVFALVVGGCTATITMRDGTEVEEEILWKSRSDPEALHLGNHTTLQRSQVAEIDHPTWKATAIAAAPTCGLGLGALLYVRFVEEPDRHISSTALVGMVASMACPVTTLVAGMLSFGSSFVSADPPNDDRGAAASGSGSGSGVFLDYSPVILTDGERTYYGAGGSWRW